VAPIPSSSGSDPAGDGAAASSGGSVAVELRSFDLKLPDSSSASRGLDGLDGVQLQQQAQVRLRLGRDWIRPFSPV
jgi:hypothetical protein